MFNYEKQAQQSTQYFYFNAITKRGLELLFFVVNAHTTYVYEQWNFIKLKLWNIGFITKLPQNENSACYHKWSYKQTVLEKFTLYTIDDMP